MKYFGTLLLIFLSIFAYGKSIYQFENSQIPDKLFSEGCSIVLESEHPDHIILMPQNYRLKLKGIISSVATSPCTWCETYGTERKKRIRIPVYDYITTLIDSSYSVVLFKDLEKGIYAVDVLTGTNRIRFAPQPQEIIHVTNIPPVFIKEIQFANINDKGEIIDDYGEEIIGQKVSNLSQKMIYQSLLENKSLTLEICLRTPEGRLMRDSESPNGCTRRITFNTGTVSKTLEQPLGALKAKFGKGYRMEIYCDGNQLLSIPVPTQGEMLHVPICHRTSFSFNQKNPKNSSLPSDLKAMFNILYQRNYTGPIFEGNYIVTGWKTIEI